MGLERYVVDAVLIEKRSPTEIVRTHGISRSWLYALIARVSGGAWYRCQSRSFPSGGKVRHISRTSWDTSPEAVRHISRSSNGTPQPNFYT